MSRIVSSSTNNVSVNFTSALIHHDNREIDGWWSASVSILRRKSLPESLIKPYRHTYVIDLIRKALSCYISPSHRDNVVLAQKVVAVQVDRNVTRVLDDSMPSYFVATTAIPMFTALTVIGNLSRTIYGNLTMYIGAFNNQYNPEFTNAIDFIIIDGESIAGRSLGR